MASLHSVPTAHQASAVYPPGVSHPSAPWPPPLHFHHNSNVSSSQVTLLTFNMGRRRLIHSEHLALSLGLIIYWDSLPARNLGGRRGWGSGEESSKKSSLRSAPLSVPCTSELRSACPGCPMLWVGVAISHLGAHFPLISTGLSCCLPERFSPPSCLLFFPITSTLKHSLNPFCLGHGSIRHK